MAEFMEVMRQQRRMCDTNQLCNICDLRRLNNPDGQACFELIFNNPSMFAERVMQWAAEHPEPVFPTWAEWQKITFPDYHAPIIPCMLTSCKVLECNGDCRECANKPIPADIAAKLGVKPIANKGGNKE